jgi:hypothetical protein
VIGPKDAIVSWTMFGGMVLNVVASPRASAPHHAYRRLPRGPSLGNLFAWGLRA